jgi:RNA polymerase sigma factor (sigma-70 family)
MNKIKSEKFLEFVKDGSRKKNFCRNIRNCFLKKGISFSDNDFDDIYQESIFVLYNNIGTELTSTKENAMDNFFFGVCYSQTLKFLRKQERIVNIADDDSSFDVRKKNHISSKRLNKIIQTIPTEKGYSQKEASPDDAFDLKRMKELVHNALNEMAESCRQLLTKYYLEGYNWDEIALLFKMSNGESAKSAAHRCRRRFKEKYKGLEIYVKER